MILIYLEPLVAGQAMQSFDERGAGREVALDAFCNSQLRGGRKAAMRPKALHVVSDKVHAARHITGM